MDDAGGIYTILHLNLPLLVILVLVFLAIILSSFVKIITILGIIRAGFGFHNIPTALVTGGVALVLSFFIMAPVISQSAVEIDINLRDKKTPTDTDKLVALDRAGEKWKTFLNQHTHPEQIAIFSKLAVALDQRNNSTPAVKSNSQEIELTSWRIVAPAFIVSELKEAFATGLSLFLPFFIIDLFVAAILTAVELKSLNPSLVGLPLKLLLFVVADGWSLITANLVSTYIK